MNTTPLAWEEVRQIAITVLLAAGAAWLTAAAAVAWCRLLRPVIVVAGVGLLLAALAAHVHTADAWASFVAWTVHAATQSGRLLGEFRTLLGTLVALWARVPRD